MSQCPLCGDPVGPDFKFCNNCGVPLVRPVPTAVLSETNAPQQYTPVQVLAPLQQTTPIAGGTWHFSDLWKHNKQCPVCGAEAISHQQFCNSCGSPLTGGALETVFQPQVGGQVTPAFTSTAYQANTGAVAPIDPWRFSYPGARNDYASDWRAIDGLKNTLRLDPYPARTNAIQDEIDALLQNGQLQRGAGHWYCCPWSSEYIVMVNHITVHGKRYYHGQSFVFHISAEDMPKGEPFFCDLIDGPFNSSKKVEFCSPRVAEEGDDD